MIDKKHQVNIPNGAIKRSNGNVLWVVDKIYNQQKHYNVDKRVVIGRIANNDKTRMYPNNNYKKLFPAEYSTVLKPSQQLSLSNYSLGLYAVIRKIVHDIPLYNNLVSVFGEQDANLIIDYAMYQIIYQSNIAKHFRDKMKDKIIFSDTVRSDTYLSRFFKSNINNNKIDEFLKFWSTSIIEARKLDKAYINVDGTNVDCEAKGVSLAEEGYSKSKKGKDIVGLMYAVAPDGTPITYLQYRGSIVDKVAIRHLILNFKALKIKIGGFCVDRGFISKQNVDILKQEKIDFVMMLTNQPDGFTKAIDALRNKISNNINKWIQGSELFGESTKLKLFKNDTKDSWLHVYYDNFRRGKDINKLLRKINITTNKLKTITDKEVNIPKDIRKYISVQKKCNKDVIQIHLNKLQDTINHVGYHVLCTSAKMTTLEAYNIYRARDSIEKQFMAAKSLLGEKAYRTKSDALVMAKQLIVFVAGIIRNEISLASKRLLENSERSELFNVPTIIEKLLSIRMTRLYNNRYSLVMNLSRKESAILKQFNLKQNDLETIVNEQNEKFGI